MNVGVMAGISDYNARTTKTNARWTFAHQSHRVIIRTVDTCVYGREDENVNPLIEVSYLLTE